MNAQRPAWQHAGLALLAALFPVAAWAGDPKAPAGRDPGGERVVLLLEGVDYTDAEIAGVLARDGEGELMAWDVVDNDRMPFGASPDSAALIRELTRAATAGGQAAISIVAVRVAKDDPLSLAKALAFAARTPVSTVLVPFSSDSRELWQPFAMAADHFKHLRIYAPACEGVPAAYPRDLGVANVGASPSSGAPASEGLAAMIGVVGRQPCRTTK